MAHSNMVEWIFNEGSVPARGLKLGVGGLVLTTLVTSGLQHLTWASPTQAIISGLLAITLAVAAGFGSGAQGLRVPVALLAVAYAWMALLYLFDIIPQLHIPTGFEPITDLMGTLFFVAAWFVYSRRESAVARHADVVLMIAISLLAFLASAIKLDLPAGKAGDPSHEAARLALNLANGGVLLGLYASMRRTLPPPDPVSHTLIVLYGCAQVASHGRDCLKASPVACALDTPQGMTAAVIGWALVLGKIALAAYVSYAYFNATDAATEPPGRAGLPLSPSTT